MAAVGGDAMRELTVVSVERLDEPKRAADDETRVASLETPPPATR